MRSIRVRSEIGTRLAEVILWSANISTVTKGERNERKCDNCIRSDDRENERLD
jgi:hypothetical protein